MREIILMRYGLFGAMASLGGCMFTFIFGVIGFLVLMAIMTININETILLMVLVAIFSIICCYITKEWLYLACILFVLIIFGGFAVILANTPDEDPTPQTTNWATYYLAP